MKNIIIWIILMISIIIIFWIFYYFNLRWTKITQHFKVNKKGHLNRTCPRGNIEAKKCKDCEDLLSMTTFYGDIKKVICRSNGIEGYNYHIKRKLED